MASAQLTEEELQQSAILSEEDAEFEDAPCIPADQIPQTTESPLTNPNTHDDELSDAVGDEDNQGDASVIENDVEMGEYPDDNSELSEQESLDEELEIHSQGDMDRHTEQDERDDASGGARSRSSSLLDDIEEDEAEGVGAVKIRPGETDDEDADDPESDHTDSHSESANESEEDAAWDEVAAAGEDDEEGSEDAAPNTCMFCKQDEEHDPAEDFEEFLTCVDCGENSHQHCARAAGALQDLNSASQWKCLDCASEDQAPVDDAQGDATLKQERDNADEHYKDKEREPELDVDLSPSSRRSTASQVARDLLPAQKGTIKPDSHSVFNHLLLDGDPMDGSRVLRKRKTSSVEADDVVVSLRKRRRNVSKERDSSQGAGTSQDGPNGIKEKDSRRKLRLNPARKAQAVTITRRSRSIIVKMRVKTSALRRALSRKSESSRRRVERAGTAASSHDGLTAAMTGSFTSSDYTHPFYSFFDRETDDVKTKPYGGILSETEADTSRTLPTNDDRRRFDEAKQKAEEVWRARLQSAQLNLATPAKRSKKNSGPASQIECIDFGGWEIDTWYAAPYPEEYSRNRTLYICEFCLKYMNSDYVAWRHKLKCPAKHPPGDEIYRHGSVSVFEVDGRKNPVYCQNLCLLAKLFLGSKTLYYDVEPFLFYVLCEYDALGYHFVGYFSKEKRASSQNNVSCILTLPIHQRKGYGNLLIDFSYLLTRVERKTGSPEKPLSDMGLVSYRNYWRLVLCRYLLDHVEEDKSAAPGLSIRQMSDDTGLTPDDVISALEGLRCLVRDPQTELYAFRVDIAYCNEYIAKWEAKDYVKLNPDSLTWTPYVMGRGNATNFELGPAISAIAPREEDDSQKPAHETLPPTSQQDPTTNGLPTKDIANSPHTPDGASFASTEGVGKDVNGSKAGNDVYESTESHHDGLLLNGNTVKEQAHEEASRRSEVPHPTTPGPPVGQDWAGMYKNVPPSRFEVYPPPGGRRSDRPRPSVPRPSVARNTSNSSRPRRSGGGSSVRRPTATRPKSKSSSSSSRRKTGGTGRGPGRWPKGTKKSDYGNADSGPGLPPGWVKDKQQLASLGVAKGQEVEGLTSESKETIDVVRVQFEKGAQDAASGNVAGGYHGSHGNADGRTDDE
ncbi:MOZ/SAS family protein [Colletotrichum higginsianum]|uniref:Histone acetyltransferase n=2 Tax=Colletotrichum higginsianum TaxID=80884 RepID=H1W5K7_COLHI|nr:Histone acetyltransferase [Colletotrichum higginsianum IMI 349063]OBR10699.1 Histone acetyltransferase [Colletotrichum higginsianum IMI 349063]CCF47771.1 MOZ/SAS family protein [Colletotrichum higginsianum]